MPRKPHKTHFIPPPPQEVDEEMEVPVNLPLPEIENINPEEEAIRDKFLFNTFKRLREPAAGMPVDKPTFAPKKALLALCELFAKQANDYK